MFIKEASSKGEFELITLSKCPSALVLSNIANYVLSDQTIRPQDALYTNSEDFVYDEVSKPISVCEVITQNLCKSVKIWQELSAKAYCRIHWTLVIFVILYFL